MKVNRNMTKVYVQRVEIKTSGYGDQKGEREENRQSTSCKT